LKTVLIISLLFVSAVSAATMSPPAIEWERLYFPGYWSRFNCITETDDGGYAAAITVSSSTANAFYRLSADGDILWAARSDLDNQGGRVVKELQNGDFIVAGYGRELPSSSSALMIGKYSSTGQEIWTKLYNSSYPGSEIALSFALLPDGGFAICGDIDPEEGMNQAWILRTDAQGDTLWTREWGWIKWDRARGILCIDDVITVLCSGRLEGDPGGTYIVRYSLNGDLLSEYRIPEMQGRYGFDMCEASDNGLLIVNNYHPDIFHTDYLGNYQWEFEPPGWGSNYGWSVSTTMDGGILFGGENAEYVPSGDTRTELSGMISRHDSQGNELWRDYVYNSGCTAIYSARQLSQGGYIAAGKAWSPESGQQGFLIKYAQETGIESGDVSSTSGITELSPNPFSVALGITFNLPSEANVSITVYDLAGRVAGTVAEGVFPAGISTVEWVASRELSSGCYLVRFDTADGYDFRNCILLR